MARLNSLMEWVDQTKKFSKSVDYMALDVIDSIMKVRTFVDRKVLYKNKFFFDEFCGKYHKPNPLRRLITTRGLSNVCKKQLSIYVAESVERLEVMRKAVDVQWFEIIDFIYDRPELVDPSILRDEYVREQIGDVCANKKKNNPFENGMVSRLGKSWKDKNGKWRPERRKRF